MNYDGITPPKAELDNVIDYLKEVYPGFDEHNHLDKHYAISVWAVQAIKDLRKSFDNKLEREYEDQDFHSEERAKLVSRRVEAAEQGRDNAIERAQKAERQLNELLAYVDDFVERHEEYSEYWIRALKDVGR